MKKYVVVFGVFNGFLMAHNLFECHENVFNEKEYKWSVHEVRRVYSRKSGLRV